MTKKINYQSGFAAYLESEAKAHALPLGQNNPQKPAFGLYAEQLSGTAFTVPRAHNKKSWLYRILPSVLQSQFQYLDKLDIQLAHPFPPTQMRWDPMPMPIKSIDFIHGLKAFAVNGEPKTHSGAAIYLYACNQSMDERYFYNADGEFLIVPQQGQLHFATEFGHLEVKPGEIIVIPRGIKFQVRLKDKTASGYLLENYGAHFSLPERGPIGANGLANERDFLAPLAAFENKSGKFQLICKFQNHYWQATLNHSPLDVVAWHGNYYPYKYDLTKFNTINTVSFDHPDPSIFTVLTSQTNTPGTANVDFVIFPERWMVAENTFRPPYYHRNVMNEFMGLIYGVYDAKETDFKPGGASLHNSMSPHGPDKQAFEKATNATLKPQKITGTLAFMFESIFAWQPTEFAMHAKFRQENYIQCWEGLKSNF